MFFYSETKKDRPYHHLPPLLLALPQFFPVNTPQKFRTLVLHVSVKRHTKKMSLLESDFIPKGLLGHDTILRQRCMIPISGRCQIKATWPLLDSFFSYWPHFIIHLMLNQKMIYLTRLLAATFIF